MNRTSVGLILATMCLAACDQSGASREDNSPGPVANTAVDAAPIALAAAQPAAQDPALDEQLRAELVGAAVEGCPSAYVITAKGQLIEVAIANREFVGEEQILTVPATLRADPTNWKADLRIAYRQADGAWKVSKIVALTCAPLPG